MSTHNLKVLTVVGARPQFIKAAAVSRAIALHPRRAEGRLEEMVCHTGQHYDQEMSRVFFEELSIPEPRHHLSVGSGSHGAQTGRMLEALERVMLEERPACVLVYGDTNSTLAAALAASKLHIPVCHVEAGLRSFNRDMPEEINRVLTDHVAVLHFCPTPTAVQNLAREGITEGVHLIGDVMFDMIRMCREVAERRSDLRERLGLACREYYLATVHRPSNTDDPAALARILAAFGDLDACVLFPLHPRVRDRIRDFGLEPEVPGNVLLHSPLSYLDMLAVQANAALVLTDSGGVQKEARILGVPCVTLREDTEWVETLEDGWNRLAGSDRERITRGVREALATRLEGGRDCALYGEGTAAARIVEVILRTFSETA